MMRRWTTKKPLPLSANLDPVKDEGKVRYPRQHEVQRQRSLTAGGVLGCQPEANGNLAMPAGPAHLLLQTSVHPLFSKRRTDVASPHQHNDNNTLLLCKKSSCPFVQNLDFKALRVGNLALLPSLTRVGAPESIFWTRFCKSLAVIESIWAT